MDPAYLEGNEPAVLVRDFLASMTDAHFLRQSQELFFPRSLPARFA